MRIIDITHPPQSLWIGREGENTFRPVSFECANWFSAYPDATIVAYYQPYGAADPYPLVLVEDGTKRIWHPLLNELVKGDGELQIVLMHGDTVGTSAIIPTKVDRSLISSADHPASESPSWAVAVVQDVTEQADRAEAAVSHYPQIRNDYWWVWDVESGEFVSTGISAQGEDGVSPTVTVTAIEGGHRVTITDADGAHTFDVMDGEGGSGSGAVESVNGMTGAVVLGAADVGALPNTYTAPVQSVNGQTGVVNLTAFNVGAVNSSTYAADMAQVNTELQNKLSTANLQAALDDDVPPARFTLAMNGNTLTTVETFAVIANLLISTSRRVMFIIVTAQSGGTVQSALELYPTMIDTNNRLLTLVGYFDGDRYTAELTAASVSSTMTGTLAVEPIVTQSDIPTAVSELTNDSGYQTAPFEIEITESGTTFSTTATAQEILDNADNCVAVLSGGNEVIKPDFIARNGSTMVSILFTIGIVAEGLGVSQIALTAAYGNVTVQGSSTRFTPLPDVTSVDNGKFLRVVNGAWAAETVQTWQGGSY